MTPRPMRVHVPCTPTPATFSQTDDLIGPCLRGLTQFSLWGSGLCGADRLLHLSGAEAPRCAAFPSRRSARRDPGPRIAAYARLIIVAAASLTPLFQLLRGKGTAARPRPPPSLPPSLPRHPTGTRGAFKSPRPRFPPRL